MCLRVRRRHPKQCASRSISSSSVSDSQPARGSLVGALVARGPPAAMRAVPRAVGRGGPRTHPRCPRARAAVRARRFADSARPRTRARWRSPCASRSSRTAQWRWLEVAPAIAAAAGLRPRIAAGGIAATPRAGVGAELAVAIPKLPADAGRRAARALAPRSLSSPWSAGLDAAVARAPFSPPPGEPPGLRRAGGNPPPPRPILSDSHRRASPDRRLSQRGVCRGRRRRTVRSPRAGPDLAAASSARVPGERALRSSDRLWLPLPVLLVQLSPPGSASRVPPLTAIHADRAAPAASDDAARHRRTVSSVATRRSSENRAARRAIAPVPVAAASNALITCLDPGRGTSSPRRSWFRCRFVISNHREVIALASRSRPRSSTTAPWNRGARTPRRAAHPDALEIRLSWR